MDRPVRALFISPMIAPYRNPLFNSLARHPALDLKVIYLCRRHRREWDLHLDEIEYSFTILTHGGLRHEGLTWGGLVPRRMASMSFDVVVVSGYDHPAYLQAILLARALGKKVALWSESTPLDRRTGGGVRTFLKKRIVGLCDGFLASGTGAREYLMDLGAPRDRIHIVLDVVDSAFFRDASRRYLGEREAWRRRLGLPDKVILFVGRLHRWKGVGDLLAAFRRLKGTDVGLVLAGSGPALETLRRRALARGWRNVFFPGFVPRNRLPMYYAVADLFVLPSWSDPWGLVVNEAMASGLPVVVSSQAGAGRDLVRSGENGFVYPARDTERLRSALETLLGQPELRTRMGEASSRMIARYTPAEAARAMSSSILHIAAGGSRPAEATA